MASLDQRDLVPPPGHLDASTQAYVHSVLRAIETHAPIREAYLLGSAAVGGFDPTTSDVDLVVVVAHPLDGARGSLVADVGAIPCPVRDLELVLYVEGSQPPAFELNLNGGKERPDEEGFWFVLDSALAQDHALPLRNGLPWTDVFEAIPEERIRQAARASLAWSERQPPDDEFARLNATRARRYLEQGEWVSKAGAAR